MGVCVGVNNCNEALGLETTDFPDFAFSASSQFSSSRSAKHARLRDNSGSWTAGVSNTDQYLQVDLDFLNENTRYKITAIDVQGRPNSNEYISEFMIKYNDDRHQWIFLNDELGAPKKFVGNSNSSGILHIEIVPAIITKKIQIVPFRWNSLISLRLELYGCKYETSVISFISGNDAFIRYNLTRNPYHGKTNDISLRFKTHHKDAVLIHALSSQTDHLVLELKDARLFLNINLGNEKKEKSSDFILEAGSLLDDGQWHDVTIFRTSNYASLIVDRIQVGNKVSNYFQQLDLDLSITFGGVPSFGLPILSVKKNFVGCMEGIQFEDVDVIQEAKDGKRDFEIINKVNFFCSTKTYSAITFTTSSSYFTWSALSGISALNITLEFRTFELDGLLAYHHFASGGHFILYLSNGNVEMLIRQDVDVGSKHVIRPFQNVTFNDGLWHKVVAAIQENKIHLNIDYRVSQTLRRISIKTGQTYMIGGGSIVDDSNIPGFIGCMGNVILDSRFIPLSSLKKGEHFEDGVILNACSLIDRCHPNPCEHSGRCYQTWKEFFCDCSSTGYTGAVCHMSIHPTSCTTFAHKLINLNNRDSEISMNRKSLIIDVDGSGPFKPMEVECESNRQGEISTILKHDSDEETVVTGFPRPGSYLEKIQYHHPLEYIFKVVERSSSCEQRLSYKCINSKLMNSPHVGKAVTWWISANNQKMTYWGGAPVNSQKCACGVKKSCIDQNFFCNCDAEKDYLLEDSGYIRDKQHLPILELHVGGTGSTSGGGKAYFQVGPLVCSGDKYFENGVTFQKEKAILLLPPLKFGSSGDIFLTFKTSQSYAVIFENIGSTRYYMSLKLVEGSKVQLDYSFGGDIKSLLTVSSQPLNNNKWHSIQIELNRKEFRVGVDSYEPAIASGERHGINFEFDKNLILGGKFDTTDGFVGCIRSLVINGDFVDLVSSAEEANETTIKVGCVGACDEDTQYPCMNEGVCKEAWSQPICDCTYTAFRGPYCTEEIGTHFKGESGVRYEISSTPGGRTTVDEYLHVAFTTLHLQGVLMEVTSFSGDFISIQLQNNGGLRVRFNFGYETQEFNDDRPIYSNGIMHDVKLYRKNDGNTLVLDVDDYEPLVKRYETGSSQDTKFNDLKNIYIGRNATTKIGKGFIGCISRVQFVDIYPLKSVFEDPPPENVHVFPADTKLVEDMCGIIPETPIVVPGEDMLPETVNIYTFGPSQGRKYNEIKITIVIACLIVAFVILIAIGILIGQYCNRFKGDYVTHEDDGAKASIDADIAMIKGPTGGVDVRKEWLF